MSMIKFSVRYRQNGITYAETILALYAKIAVDIIRDRTNKTFEVMEVCRLTPNTYGDTIPGTMDPVSYE